MTRNYSEEERVIALAAIFQAARLVRDLARHGRCDREALESSIRSLFDFDPIDVTSPFGGIQGVQHGLTTLAAQLGSPTERDLEIASYVISLIHHADKLLRDRERIERLTTDLERLADKEVHVDLPGFALNAQLSRLYQTHVSPVPPQILVKGEPLYLQNPQITDDIRAALLAGLRAAVLWRQCGGKRWHFLVRRRSYEGIARRLLERNA